MFHLLSIASEPLIIKIDFSFQLSTTGHIFISPRRREKKKTHCVQVTQNCVLVVPLLPILPISFDLAKYDLKGKENNVSN